MTDERSGLRPIESNPSRRSNPAELVFQLENELDEVPIAMGEHPVDATRYGTLNGRDVHSLLFDFSDSPKDRILAHLQRNSLNQNITFAGYVTICDSARDVLGLTYGLAGIDPEKRQELMNKLMSADKKEVIKLSGALYKLDYQLYNNHGATWSDDDFGGISHEEVELLKSGIIKAWDK